MKPSTLHTARKEPHGAEHPVHSVCVELALSIFLQTFLPCTCQGSPPKADNQNKKNSFKNYAKMGASGQDEAEAAARDGAQTEAAQPDDKFQSLPATGQLSLFEMVYRQKKGLGSKRF